MGLAALPRSCCMISAKKPDLSELQILQLKVKDNTYHVSRERIWTVSHTIKRGRCTSLFNHTNTFSSECFCSFPVKCPSLHPSAKYIVNVASSENSLHRNLGVLTPFCGLVLRSSYISHQSSVPMAPMTPKSQSCVLWHGRPGLQAAKPKETLQ